MQPINVVDGLCDLDMGYKIFERSNVSMNLPYNQKFIPYLETSIVIEPIYWTQFYQQNWFNTIYLSIGYMILAGFGVKRMENRPAFELKRSLIIWNWFLAVFSLMGSIRLGEELLAQLTTHGFNTTVCYTVIPYSVSSLWSFLFGLSKVVELGDTVFLVLRKRPVTLLHLYHHASVLVYTWQSGAEHTAAGRWYMTINYSVHAVMYTYFALKAQGSKIPLVISMLVTLMQLTQMVAGIYINYTVYTLKTSGKACQCSWFNLYFCWFIYGTYFLLFLKFFIESYVVGGREKCYATQKQRLKTE